MAWTRTIISGAIIVAAGLLLSWLLYGRRWIRTARTLVIASPLAAILFWTSAFSFSDLWPAHARALPETPQSRGIGLTFGPGCFERLGKPAFAGDPDRHGITFAYRQIFDGVPSGARLVLDQTDLGWGLRGHSPRYGDYIQAIEGSSVRQDFGQASYSAGSTTFSAPARPDGVLEGRFQHLYRPMDPKPARPFEARYHLTLLEPVKTFQIPVGGTRRHIPGLGYCQASPARHPRGEPLGDTWYLDMLLGVDCFIPGAQPDLVVFSEPGQPDVPDCASCFPDYRPQVVEVLGGRRYTTATSVRQGAAQVVEVTTYKATARFIRSARTETPWGSATCTPETLPVLQLGPDGSEPPTLESTMGVLR